MTEPVNNNQWLEPNGWLWNFILEVGAEYANGRPRHASRFDEAKLAILSKLESIEQEAKVDVWQEVDNLALGYRSYRMSDVAQERLRQLKGKG